MPHTNYQAVADLASDIRQKVSELGRGNPDLDFHILRLVYDYLNQDQKDYEILEDNDPRLEGAFPD